MALPIQPKDTQASCNPISSNCVIWQGPDIPCLTLCKGDSISDVTYKIATELCTLIEQLDIKNFDLTCFNAICPKPENINDLIQFILDTLCAQQGCCNQTGTTVTAGCPADCIIEVCPAFYSFNSFGQQVTTLTIAEYVSQIGVKVCSLLDRVGALETQVATLTYNVNNLLACDPCNPPTPVITVAQPSCIGTGNDTIQNVVANIGNTLCALQAATGNPAEIGNAIAKECANLDITPTLNNNTVTYGSLPGWVLTTDYNTAADAINNMWLVICDMRNKLYSIATTCCSNSCDDLVINMTSSFNSPNIELTFNGSAGPWSDCPLGMLVTITDGYGVIYTQYVSVIPNLGAGAQLIDLTGSGLSLSTNYTVQLTICATDDGGLTKSCSNVIFQTVTNSALCPPLGFVSIKDTSVDYSFYNSISTPVTYAVELWNAFGTTLINTNTYVNPSVGTQTGTFSGLTLGVTYQIRVTTTISGVTTPCSFVSFTTTL